MSENENENRVDRDAKGRFSRGNQAAVRHGGHRYLKTGKIPQKIRGTMRIKHELTRIKKALEGDIVDLDTKKSLLINQIIKSAGFCSLFELYCKKMGLLDPTMGKKGRLDFQPGFKIYLSLMNAQKNAIMALGLDEKQVDEALTPFEIIEKEEQEGKRPEKSRG